MVRAVVTNICYCCVHIYPSDLHCPTGPVHGEITRRLSCIDFLPDWLAHLSRPAFRHLFFRLRASALRRLASSASTVPVTVPLCASRSRRWKSRSTPASPARSAARTPCAVRRSASGTAAAARRPLPAVLGLSSASRALLCRVCPLFRHVEDGRICVMNAISLFCGHMSVPLCGICRIEAPYINSILLFLIVDFILNLF